MGGYWESWGDMGSWREWFIFWTSLKFHFVSLFVRMLVSGFGIYQKVYEKSKLNNCRLSTQSMIYVDRSTIMYHREGSLVCMGVQTIFVI